MIPLLAVFLIRPNTNRPLLWHPLSDPIQTGLQTLDEVF